MSTPQDPFAGPSQGGGWQPLYGDPQYGPQPVYGQPAGHGYGYPPALQPGFGYPPPPAYSGYPQQLPGNGMAVAGMVCGMVAVALFWMPIIGWILAILGIVFGGVGVGKASDGAPNRGMAITGIVLGSVSLALYAVVMVALFNSLA